MSNYDIYVRSLTELGERLGFPFEPMPLAEFDQAEAALQQKIPYVYSSVIDMDAFEAALG